MCPYYIFRRFLIEKGCETAFEKAFGSQNAGYMLDATLWEILAGDEFFFGRAFDWSATTEGREFWARMDSEWYSMCIGSKDEKTI